MRVVAHDLLDADADTQRIARQIEEVAEFAVPADQPMIAIEDGDALTREIQGILQEVAIVLDRGGGFVHQAQRRLVRNVAPAQNERQHQPRGRRTDGRGQQSLGEAQHMHIGFGAALARLAAGGQKGIEGFARARGAEIAGHRRFQFARRHARAPEAQGARRWEVGAMREAGGLQPLDARGPAKQRDEHECDDVERQRRDRAVHDLRQAHAEQRGRLERGDAEHAVLHDVLHHARRKNQRRQEQRVGPHGHADAHAGHRADPGTAAPEQATEEGRRDLRDAGEGD